MQQFAKYFENDNLQEYRPLPFWSWNDQLDLDKLIEQIRWMDANHIGGFFMHARSGLKTEYLSDEWMNDIEVCADEAQKRNMKAWAYDENGWPSGFAGGKLLEEEKNCDRYVLWNTGAYDSSADVSYSMDSDKLVRVQSDIEPAEGEYLNLYLRTSVSTADIANPEVVDKFIALTHEQYKERFGDTFAEKIEGFFTDEPQYQRWFTPYTDMLPVYFKEKFGEDILDSLGLLFVEKEGYRKFRYRYWKALQELILENFAHKVYDWCVEHDVKLTGHYVEESTLGYQLMCCGGVMPFYEYESIPGIDWLGKATVSDLPSRQVGSVAAQLGKKRVISETFGCCGWDVTPAELRRIAGFQYATGVNMMCHHLIPYSERGIRKYDYPAHYGKENPWVCEAFDDFNRYFTRLGYLLGESKSHIKVAMLHPMRSAYFDYKRELEPDAFGIRELELELTRACKEMSKHGIEYHFLDETLLAKYGFVKDGTIGCGECAYEYLVLPSLVTMDETTERLLHEYVKQGGKILLMGDKPSYIEAESYAYDYLESNCLLEDIMAEKPFAITNYETDIYATYKTMDDLQFIYAVNASETETYVQTFSCGEGIKSFKKVDLTDLSVKKVPLTIEFLPGEDAFLIPCEEEVEVSQKETLEVEFAHAKVSAEENYLPIDYICYSTDGVDYSKPWPCQALFHKLLKEHYEGKLFLKYNFEISNLPERLQLRVENTNLTQVWVNEHALTEVKSGPDWYINEYDIASCVSEGENSCVLEMQWHQDESVYYALFGENVTESLKNCIVYDAEIQPIELVGNFGVYTKEGYVPDTDARFVRGSQFYIGKAPEYVNDIALEGYPFFSGNIKLKETIVIENPDTVLHIKGNYHMAYVTLNGKEAGRLFFDKKLDVSHVAKEGENELEVRFVMSNLNRLGPNHLNADKNISISPYIFGLHTDWQEDEWNLYHDYYDIRRFYVNESQND